MTGGFALTLDQANALGTINEEMDGMASALILMSESPEVEGRVEQAVRAMGRVLEGMAARMNGILNP